MRQGAPERALSPRQVAETYGFSYQTLANWRCQGEGPPYFKGKGRSGRVKYRVDDIEAWLDANMVRPEDVA